jgi:hypothetical protein
VANDREEKRAQKDEIEARELERVRLDEIVATAALSAGHGENLVTQEEKNCAADGELEAASGSAPVVEKGKRGAKSQYTVEEGLTICTWIAEGRSLRSYCRASGRSIDAIYRWLRSDSVFREQYARAHEDRADTLADELLDIADGVTSGTNEEIQAARLRIEARKWIASKLRPSKWGEQREQVKAQNVVFNIGLPQKTHSNGATIDAEPLERLERVSES